MAGFNVFESQEDVNDDVGHGYHNETRIPSNVERVKQLLNLDCCLSIRDITDKASINPETIRLIVKDKLRLRKLYAKLVRKNLTEEQKTRQADVCRDWLEAIESENILECVITCDEGGFSSTT